MKTLNELCLLRAIETYVLNDDKMKVYNYLKSVVEILAGKTVSYLKIDNSTRENETNFEHIEIWQPFENHRVGELLELIEADYQGNLNFVEEIHKCM